MLGLQTQPRRVGRMRAAISVVLLDASADVAALILATKSLRSSQTERWLVCDPTGKAAMSIGACDESKTTPSRYAAKHLLGHYPVIMRYQ